MQPFAFFDDGSSLTLIEEGLVEQLGIDGITVPLCLLWTANVSRIEKKYRNRYPWSFQPQGEDVLTVKKVSLLILRQCSTEYSYARKIATLSGSFGAMIPPLPRISTLWMLPHLAQLVPQHLNISIYQKQKRHRIQIHLLPSRRRTYTKPLRGRLSGELRIHIARWFRAAELGIE